MTATYIRMTNARRALLATARDAVRSEKGEIGSQLIVMAVLVAAAVFAVSQFSGPLGELVTSITGGLETDTSVGGGE